MAQLVKLRDYVSRYEWNIYRYPTRFIRLKQENWEKMKQDWKNTPNMPVPNESRHIQRSKLLRFLPFSKKQTSDDPYKIDQKTHIPKSEAELKHQFLDELLSFQFKWASSTVSAISFVDPSVYNDAHLIYFLQRFPDTYLLLYYPVFYLKKATVDAEVILISPLDIEIIHLIETDQPTTIKTKTGHTWEVEKNSVQSTMLNPEISLKRTETIIKSLLSQYSVEMPVNRTVLAKNASVITDHDVYQTAIVDKKRHDQWLQHKRKLSSPLKNIQLKTAGIILKYCMSSSVKRPEWEEDGPDVQTDHND